MGLRSSFALHFFVALLFASARLSLAQDVKPYDEAFAPDGTKREHYQIAEKILGRDLLKLDPELEAKYSNFPLQDKIKILPYPLVLSKEDTKTITIGAHQRLSALVGFFEDMVLGEQSIVKKGIFPNDLADKILKHTDWKSLEGLRRFWKGASPRQIAFVYAPDFMRGPDGVWRAGEDNVGGNMGGLADTSHLRYFFERDISEAHREGLGYFSHPNIDFDKMIQAIAEMNGHDVALRYGWMDQKKAIGATHYSASFLRGLVALVFHDRPDDELKDKERLKSDFESFRLRQLLEPWEELGLKINDPTMLSNSFNGADIKAILNFDSTTKRSDKKFLRAQFKKGKILLNAPGTDDLLANKLLTPYIDEFIRFYIGDEPTVPTIPSKLVTIAELWMMPEAERRKYVGKVDNGAQGKGVHIFARQTKKENAASLISLTAEYGKRNDPTEDLVVLQEFLEASTLNRYSIDIRPIGFAMGGISDGTARTGRAFWGRAVRTNESHGKHNVSQSARELIVLAMNAYRRPDSCEKVLEASFLRPL